MYPVVISTKLHRCIICHISNGPCGDQSITVLALRTHAVSSANWYLVLPVLLLGLVPVGTNLYTIVAFPRIWMPQLQQCIQSVTISSEKNEALLIATRISVVFSDILVVGATWYYLLIHRPAALAHTQLFSMVLVSKPHLPTLVLRDGTLYFLAISLLNVYLLVWSQSALRVDGITSLINVLSSILAGRFLLHIRSAASRRNASSGSQYSDSQSAADTASLETRSWISSVEFIVDIGDDNDQTCNADLSSDDEDANVQEQDEEPVAMSVTQC